jgi:hypothetical protein
VEQVAALQIEPDPQLVPSASPDHSVVLAAGLQTWQAFAAFVAPAA